MFRGVTVLHCAISANGVAVATTCPIFDTRQPPTHHVWVRTNVLAHPCVVNNPVATAEDFSKVLLVVSCAINTNIVGQGCGVSLFLTPGTLSCAVGWLEVGWNTFPGCSRPNRRQGSIHEEFNNFLLNPII